MLITIDEPEEGELLRQQITVHGRAFDCHTELQVLILSADGLWYQQKRVNREGSRWWTDVKVGYEDPNAQEYTVAVLGGGERIPSPDPLEHLPEGYLVQTVSIRRR